MIGVGARVAEPQAAPPEPDERVGWRDIDLSALNAADERPFWIALSLIPGLGPVGFARLLRRYGTAQRAWLAGPALLDSLPRQVPEAGLALRRLRRRGPAAITRRVEADVRRAGGSVLTPMDPGYPPALAVSDPRPPVLYATGDLAAFEQPAVAIVGTRRATGYGRSVAQELADELARAGVTVISGLALGIDGEAHAAAVAAGGRSVAVLPSPLDRIYPPRHRDLAAGMVAGGGALISEVAPGNVIGRPDFARRNRIIAGLAQAVVVVEAPDRSGALLTAAAAIQLNRELYAVPGPIDSVASRGCNRLIADQQANMVTSSAGLLTSIGVRSETRPISVATLSESEGSVLYKLLEKPRSVEELLPVTGLATSTLASALTLLEARGLVTAYGGATFHPTLAARRIGQVR
ncbi:MAG TPA: DNA-processing protein DprA [Candidatus Limnocylindria bacterium]